MATSRGKALVGVVICIVLASLSYTRWCTRGSKPPIATPHDQENPAPTPADAQPPSDAIRELVGSPEPSASSAEARLVFLSTQDTSALSGLPVQLNGEGAVTLERETDAAGSIGVPEGRWILSPRADHYAVRHPTVDATANQQQVVWVSVVGSLRVRIQDASGQPIAGACVALEAEDALTGPVRTQSDADGFALFHKVVSNAGDWLIASKAGWLPAQRQVASLPKEGEHTILTLSPDLSGQALVLECLDDNGAPLEGVDVHLRPQRYGDRDVWLGKSSATGSIEVGSLVHVLPCEFWFRGPVYTTRLSIAQPPADEVLRAYLPRAVRGTILVTGGSPTDRVEVTVIDAGVTAIPPASQYVNATGRWITPVDGQIRTELPKNRRVKITCRTPSGRASTQFFTATDDSWQLTAALDNPKESHLVTLIPRGGAIGSVLASGSPVEVWRSGDVVSFRTPAGFLHIEARAQHGDAGVSLSGQLRQDTVLDVPLPELHLIPYSVRDPKGGPIRDVEVEFRRTSQLSRDTVAGTSFKAFPIPNILRGTVDARGDGKVALIAGDYDVWLRNLSFRDGAGAWRPVAGAKLTSPADGILAIVTGKPRRVMVHLKMEEVDRPIRWRVHAHGDILGVFQGSVGILWCSNDQQEISVRSEAGELLGNAVIPEGADDCVIDTYKIPHTGR